MSKKLAKKESVRIKDLQPRPPLTRGLKQGLRGVVAIMLWGLNEGTDAATRQSVFNTSGKDTISADTSVDQDYY